MHWITQSHEKREKKNNPDRKEKESRRPSPSSLGSAGAKINGIFVKYSEWKQKNSASLLEHIYQTHYNQSVKSRPGSDDHTQMCLVKTEQSFVEFLCNLE